MLFDHSIRRGTLTRFDPVEIPALAGYDFSQLPDPQDVFPMAAGLDQPRLMTAERASFVLADVMMANTVRGWCIEVARAQVAEEQYVFGDPEESICVRADFHFHDLYDRPAMQEMRTAAENLYDEIDRSTKDFDGPSVIPVILKQAQGLQRTMQLYAMYHNTALADVEIDPQSLTDSPAKIVSQFWDHVVPKGIENQLSQLMITTHERVRPVMIYLGGRSDLKRWNRIGLRVENGVIVTVQFSQAFPEIDAPFGPVINADGSPRVAVLEACDLLEKEVPDIAKLAYPDGYSGKTDYRHGILFNTHHHLDRSMFQVTLSLNTKQIPKSQVRAITELCVEAMQKSADRQGPAAPASD